MTTDQNGLERDLIAALDSAHTKGIGSSTAAASIELIVDRYTHESNQRRVINAVRDHSDPP